MAEFKYVPINGLKVGNTVDIDGNPCKIVSIEKSKPGKHGSAKARIVGIDVFTSRKHTLLSSSSDEAKSPLIDRSNAQVVADMGESLQIMDLTTYETFTVNKPVEKELLEKIENGVEVEYIKMDDSARIIRVK